MSLTRQTQKVFGSNANANQLAVFGSMKTGTPVYSTNLATLQSTAYTQGWSEALLNDKAPYMEEMNAVQYGLSYQIAYMLQEGAFAYDANTNYSSTSIVKAFEDGKMYFYHSLIDNNTGHSLSDPTYWEKINISDTRNIGELVTSLIPLSDAGLHLLDGSVLNGSGSYGAFVTYIGQLYTANPTANYFTTEANWQTSVSTYGVCGKFVYDSTNNTVRLPKVTGILEGTTDVTALGDLVEAGLPSIPQHTHSPLYVGGSNEDLGDPGAYCVTANTQYNGIQTNSVGYTGNASTVTGGVYGNSSTVQPQTIKAFYYIVIATSTKTQIQVDIDEIATDLNGKADVDLSNTNDTAKILMSGQALPSDTYIDLTLGANGSTYTAPANGWFTIQKYNDSTIGDGYIAMVNLSNGLATENRQIRYAGSGGMPIGRVYIPAKKGDSVNVYYDITGSVIAFRFIYAVGSESEAS